MADRTGDAYLDAVDNLRQATAVSKGRDTCPIPPRLRDDRRGEVIDGDYWVSADDWWNLWDSSPIYHYNPILI